jgi:hypothetical protein
MVLSKMHSLYHPTQQKSLNWLFLKIGRGVLKIAASQNLETNALSATVAIISHNWQENACLLFKMIALSFLSS